MRISDYQQAVLQQMGIDLYQFETSSQLSADNDTQDESPSNQLIQQSLDSEFAKDVLHALGTAPEQITWLQNEQACSFDASTQQLQSSDIEQMFSAINKRELWTVLAEHFDASRWS